MATLIKLKRSAVQGNVPSTPQLEIGELALNTYDGKLYTKKSVSGTDTVVEIGGGGSSSAIFTREGFTATANQSAFTTGAILTNPSVYLNGLLLNLTEDYTTTGPTVTLVSAAQVNDEIEIFNFNTAQLLDQITSTYLRNNFTATAGQTTITTSYTVGAVDLWLNGVKLIDGTDFTATNGTSITFTSALAANDVVETLAWNASSANIGNIDSLSNTNISNIANNDLLRYNSSSSKWENTNAIQAAIEDAELLALAGI